MILLYYSMPLEAKVFINNGRYSTSRQKKREKNKIIFRRNLDYSNLYLGSQIMNLMKKFGLPLKLYE